MTYAVVPAKIQMALAGSHYTLTQALIPLFTCMFLHAGWLHIIGNMWFLWIFGANVEDRMGPVAYLLFYLICGVGSSIAQTAFSWGSHVPALGASGAIAGVLGAYIIYFPGSQILTLVTLFIIWFRAQIPAIVFIGLWFLVQFLSGSRSARGQRRKCVRRSCVVGARWRFRPGHVACENNLTKRSKCGISLIPAPTEVALPTIPARVE